MFVWIILLLVNMVASQENRCHGPSTCAECLQASKDCYWCEDHGFAFSRCNYKHILQSAAQQCNKTMNEDSMIVKRKTDRQTPFTSTVQVYPQELSIKLRPNQPHTFRVSVKPAKDYPVQIYFLMDLSSSMQDDLNNLKFLGTKIANKIRNLTQNYQLAFGSFVDKGLPPFVQPEKRDKPCTSCAPVFGYRHSFDFDKNATKFEEAVAKQVVSGNMDLPEGGFDGLMQVAVCEKMLGWRDSDITRRIAIFVTDASSHIAGDGKIGGVVMPNDGKCHMIVDPKDPTVKNYDFSIKMDYPSIAHLGLKLKEAKIVPILAVTSRHAQLYEKMNTSNSSSTLEGYHFGSGLVIGISIYYSLVFAFAIFGNIFIVSAVYRFSHMKKTVNLFLANLACADLLFALLSAFDFHVFLQRGAWMFGSVFCKIQSASLEVSYTVSVLTLTAVSLERYFSICHPYKKRRTRAQTVLISASLWLVAAIFSAILVFGYHVETTVTGQPSCANNHWSESHRLTFYIINSVVVYVLPIIVMSWSHHKILCALIYQRRRCLSESSVRTKLQKKSMKKETKSIRLLSAVILIFFILWTPFIIVRLLKYAGVAVPDILWRLTQLLVFSTTAVNCVIYASMSKPYRQAFTALFTCRRNLKGMLYSDDVSRSMDTPPHHHHQQQEVYRTNKSTSLINVL